MSVTRWANSHPPGPASLPGSVSAVLIGRVGLSPVMIGRSDPLERLNGLVEAAEVDAGDQPFVALVSGEAGIGKSRLLREFATALPSDVTLLAAQAQPASLGRPLHLVAQLAPAGSAEADISQAAIDAVVAAASQQRTVLLVEDLHWADAASAAVIDAITQQACPKLVVVGTYRSSDLSRGAPGGELVLNLERRHSVEQVRLERLDRSEVALMLTAITGRPPSSALVEVLHRRSAGIPFVLEELVRVIGPDACIDDLASAQLPWSLDDAVRQQLSGLAPDARRLIEALAVFGRPTSFDLLSAVTDLDEGALLDVLRRLVSAGVVVETFDDHFWFDHALVADAILQQLLGRERRRLHERAFDAMSVVLAPDAAALARHAQGAGRYDDLVRIARAGAPTYLRKGASFQALRLAGEALGEDPADPELLAVATEAAWRLDFTAEAMDYARRWVAVAGEGVALVDALRFLARLQLEVGDFEQCEASIAELQAFVADQPAGAVRARGYGALAQLHMLLDRGPDAVRYADLAIADADEVGDLYVAAQARIERGSALNAMVDKETAHDALVDAIARARAIGDGVLVSRGLNNLHDLLPPQSEEARVHLQELYRVAAHSGFDKLSRDALAWEMEVAFAAGDMAAYRRALEQGSARWASSSGPKADDHAFHSRVVLAIEEGRVADAGRLFENSKESLWWAALCAFGRQRQRWHNLAVLASLTDDVASAREALSGYVSCGPLRDNASVVSELVSLVDALLEAGLPPAEVRAVPDRFTTHPSMHVIRPFADGLLLAAEGDSAGAVVNLRRALAADGPTLAAPVRATVRMVLATALLAQGERAGALAEARTAHDVDLGRWPGWRRDRADGLLRRLEGSTQRADGGLTAREREVATLIAQGLTNGQLADRLYISPKTAAVHVSNILTKLGLSGRAEVAAWAVRNGLESAA
jgi:DNA-binding CsgD family transcriptional regulator/tetratricopeptide (TPR) repeat protein